MYAIVKTGGKQYRVEEGLTLLVERLPAAEGAQVTLLPLLYVDGEDVFDGEELANVTVEATVVAHERGPKLRIVKFKPKRGYKRRTGHRQELTRIRVTGIAKSASAVAAKNESVESAGADSIGSSAGGAVGIRADSTERPVAVKVPAPEEASNGA